MPDVDDLGLWRGGPCRRAISLAVGGASPEEVAEFAAAGIAKAIRLSGAPGLDQALESVTEAGQLALFSARSDAASSGFREGLPLGVHADLVAGAWSEVRELGGGSRDLVFAFVRRVADRYFLQPLRVLLIGPAFPAAGEAEQEADGMAEALHRMLASLTDQILRDPTGRSVRAPRRAIRVIPTERLLEMAIPLQPAGPPP